MIRARRLAPGDRVALVAPASPFRREDLEAGAAELQQLGFETVYDPAVFERHGAGYVAGSPRLRTEALHAAWRDPRIAGIVAIRGGYGSAQLLPWLDASLMRESRKVFVGYSDTTALLNFHLQHGVVAFHGPMVEGRLARGEAGYDRRSFMNAVTRGEPLGRLAPEALVSITAGEAGGVLAGGTLTQLAASLGTPWAFQPPDGCVLFLEDVGERPYRIDRMMTQLEQAGVIARAAAIVFGTFPGCDEAGGAPTVRAVLEELTASFSGPVVFGFPSGHTPQPTWTLPFGVRARVAGGPDPAVIIEEAAVE